MPGKNICVNPQRRAAIRVMVLERGMTTAEIGAELGLSVDVVRRWRRAAGVNAPANGGDYRTLPDGGCIRIARNHKKIADEDLDEKLKTLHAQGLNFYKIRTLAGVGTDRLARHMRALGLMEAERLVVAPPNAPDGTPGPPDRRVGETPGVWWA